MSCMLNTQNCLLKGTVNARSPCSVILSPTFSKTKFQLLPLGGLDCNGLAAPAIFAALLTSACSLVN